jgi:antitoxin (DNA-binding transcriptional repressor) of toxin-antitoxin stability system
MVRMIVGLAPAVQLCLCTRVSTSTSVRALRAELAAAVRRAADGERTIVAVNGTPRAQLGPLDDQAPDLERLLASGAVIPPRRTSPWRPPAAVPVWSGVRIDRALVELRG